MTALNPRVIAVTPLSPASDYSVLMPNQATPSGIP